MDRALNKLKDYRTDLLRIDKHLIELLAERARVAGEIGTLKFIHRIAIRQDEFWDQASEIRKHIVAKTNLDEDFMMRIFQLVQNYSIHIQQEVSNKLQDEQE